MTNEKDEVIIILSDEDVVCKDGYKIYFCKDEPDFVEVGNKIILWE